MIRAFFTGRTGASEHQRKMEITANNMANVNTDGFKSSNATFQELLHQRVRLPEDFEIRPGVYAARHAHNTRYWNNGAPPAVLDEFGEPVFQSYPGHIWTENKLRVGAGARLSENALVMTQGNLIATDNQLSAALADPRAFFAVMRLDGEIAYTRTGAFMLSNEEDGLFLVTGAGEYVLDENLEFIMLPQGLGLEEIIFRPHNHPQDHEAVVRLGVFTFANLYGLEQIGGNRFMPTEFSGESELLFNPGDDIIRQRYIEASNVNVANEMVKIIQAQRAFQSNLTAIRTADELMATVNQLRGQ